MDTDNEEHEADVYRSYIAYIGTDGIEGLVMLPQGEDVLYAELTEERDPRELAMEYVFNMDMRCRFNSHRDIKKYAICVPWEKDKFFEMLQKPHVAELVQEQGREV